MFSRELSFRASIVIAVLSLLFLLSPPYTNYLYADSKIPRVKHSVKPLDLTNPTATDIMAAGQLGGQLYPTEDIIKPIGDKGHAADVDRANKSFAKAMQEWNKHNYKEAASLLKQHLTEYPRSPWASEAMLHCGCDAQYNGRYSEAETYFTTILTKDKDNTYDGAKKMVNKASLRLGVLKVYENNFGEAGKLFTKLIKSDDWRDRTYASHWIHRLSLFKAHKRAMLNCGTLALASIMEKQGKVKQANELRMMKPTADSGYSMEELKDIALKYGYSVAGLKITKDDLNKLPLPSIVQLKSHNPGDGGHYWVLDKIKKDKSLDFFDPQAGRRFHQAPQEFDNEWDGNVLILQAKDAPINIGIKLSASEMEGCTGGCCGEPRPEDDLGPPKCEEGDCCDSGGGDGCGSPKWRVNNINMNMYVKDTPMWYQSPVGPSVEITLSYNSQSAINQNEPFGNKWQLNYGSYFVVDTGGQVILFMPDGRRDIYSPDGSGGYIRPFGVFNTLTKIAENHFTLRFPDDTVYEYNIPDGTNSLQPFLTKITDRYGQSLNFGYDSNVRLVTITDALNQVTTLTYQSGANLVQQVTDPFGRSASFEYDTDGNLVSITDMGGYTSTMTYDSNINISSIGNSRGTWSFYTELPDGIPNNSNDYPAPGGTMDQDYRITITNPVGNKQEYQYDGNLIEGWHVSANNYIPYADGSNNNFMSNVPKTLYDYVLVDEKGEINSEHYECGGVNTYQYDWATTERSSITDSKGNTTSFSYNNMGNKTSVTDAKGNTTILNYAGNNVDLTGISNGLGTVSFGYDGFHNVTSLTDRLGKKTSYTYNSFGQVTSKTNPLGNVTTYTYYGPTGAAKYKLHTIERGGLVLYSYSYDSKGRIQTVTDTTGLILTYLYNDLDQITSITYPDGKQEAYTYSSCCPKMIDSYTDRSGRTTYYTYDATKHLTQVKNPDNTIIKYVYDADGNMMALTDANGNVTWFSYDSSDRLVGKSYADGKGEVYVYDGEDLLISKKNARGITASYSYDPNNKLTGITYSDETTPNVSYTYDTYNRVTSRTDGIGAWNYSYDANSKLLTVQTPWDSSPSLTYSYDDNGRRANLQQQGGDSITYGYDTISRLNKITSGTRVFTSAYSTGSPSPIPVSLTRPNGSVTNYQYDPLQRLTEVSNMNSVPQVINAADFTYNSPTNVDMRDTETITNGQPMSLTNNLVNYNYNNVNQLTNSTNPARTYTYDADGNMTSWLTPDGYAATATYDAENRLSTVSYTDSQSVQHSCQFFYSGDGLLAKQFIDGVETRFIRDDNFNVVQERDSSNAVSRSYFWNPKAPGGIGGLLELAQGGQHYNYLYDGKGNVSAVIDSNQNVVAAYKYDDFGNLVSKSGTLDQPYQFSTKPYYASLGANYYGYRFYNPIIGKWMTRDPLRERGGLNLYGFVGNSPVNRIDPLGLAEKTIIERVVDPLFSPFMAYGFRNVMRKMFCEKAEEESKEADKFKNFDFPNAPPEYQEHIQKSYEWYELSQDYGIWDAFNDSWWYDYNETLKKYEDKINKKCK